MCRALIIISIILSFFGSVLVLVGMKCTKIGGSDLANARVTFAGGMNYLIGGKMSHRELIEEVMLRYCERNMCLLFQGCVLWLLSPIMATKLEQNFKTRTTGLKSKCNF